MTPQPQQDKVLDRIRAERLQQLREAEQPHAFDASNDGLRCAHAGGNCSLPPMADVHDPAARKATTPLGSNPRSRREQDAQRRQAKTPPPQPHWAPVAVLGNPSGRLDVRVGAGSLPCETVKIERDNEGAYLTLRIPLAHCEVRLLQAPARGAVIADDGAPPQVPEPKAPTPAPAGGVPEAQAPGAQEGDPEEPAPAPLAG